MAWGRRHFVKSLLGIPAWAMYPFRSSGRPDGRPIASTSAMSSVRTLGSSSVRGLGQTYENITYKAFLIDFQFSDIDPETMKNADAEKLAEQTAETGADSLMVYAITASGIALYKSQFAPKFKNLPDDFLGDLLDACHKRKLKTVLYHPLGFQRILDVDHPDWAMLDDQGKPQIMDLTPYGFLGKTNFLCPNSPFTDLALKQINEIADRFTFDSWFIDVYGVFEALPCYNPHCVAKWKARTGQDLPRPLPPDLQPQYLDFGIDTYRSVYRAIKDLLKTSTGRDIPITHNEGLDYVDDTYLLHESNPYGQDYYDTSVSAKAYRARALGRELQICPHLDNGYVDYVDAPVQRVHWQMATITSHNASVMWGRQANVDGTIDADTVRLAKEAYKVADRLIPKVKGTVPYAEVAVLSSERNELLTDGRGYEDFYAASRLLIDLHWPYDVVTANPLAAERLAPFRLLLIPDVNYVSAVDRQVVLDYLEKGGNVFLCGHCATVDELGKPYADPNFALVRIARETHASRGYIKPSFHIDDERLKAADVVTVEPDADHKVMGRLVRVSATRREGFPMEDVACPLETTEQPVIVIARKGKGQFVYAGYRFFVEYQKQNLPVIAEAFRELVKRFYQPAVSVEAPTVVDTIYNRLGSELRISLVNGITTRSSGVADQGLTTGGAAGYANIVELIPIANIKILLRDRRVRRATNLAGKALPVAVERGATVITVPRLERYDLISFEYA
jgi:hypothetical protein